MEKLQGFERAQIVKRPYSKANQSGSELEALATYVAHKSNGLKFKPQQSHPKEREALVVGKASTVVQVGYVGLVLLLLTFNLVMPALATVAAAITAGFAVLSGLAYAQLFLRALAPGRRPA